MIRYVIQKQILVLQQLYGLSFRFATWKLSWMLKKIKKLVQTISDDGRT